MKHLASRWDKGYAEVIRWTRASFVFFDNLGNRVRVWNDFEDGVGRGASVAVDTNICLMAYMYV